MREETLQTVANVFAIIAGIAAVLTLILLILDRRTRIRLGFRIDNREYVSGEGKRSYAVFEADNRGRSRVLLRQMYLVVNSRGRRFYEFDNTPGQGASYALLPEDPPAGVYVRMDRLARALIDAGAVFSAEIKYVAEAAGGGIHERTFVIRDLQEWANERRR